MPAKQAAEDRSGHEISSQSIDQAGVDRGCSRAWAAPAYKLLGLLERGPLKFLRSPTDYL